MVTSMTGYGKGSAVIGGGEVIVEIRTVNHRFVDFSIRTPRLLSGFEKNMEKTIRKKIRRGHVYVNVVFDRNFETENVAVNKKLLKKAYNELSDFAVKEGIPGKIDINTLLSLPDAFSNKAESIPEGKVKNAVSRALTQALNKCVAMRRVEALELMKDMKAQLADIDRTMVRIEKHAPQALKRSLARARTRLKQLLGGDKLDGNRWMVEAAVMADRADFSEELVRLKSHLGQFSTILKKGGEISKRLNFLLQEIHREATTMGNKATDSGIIRDCLSVKERVEKIREQIQNIE